MFKVHRKNYIANFVSKEWGGYPSSVWQNQT